MGVAGKRWASSPATMWARSWRVMQKSAGRPGLAHNPNPPAKLSIDRRWSRRYSSPVPMPHFPSSQKTRPLLRRPGFWILLFALLACGFLLVGSLLRPWRMLQTFPLEGAGWQPGVPAWEAGPLAGRSRFGAVTVESLGLVVTPPALLGLGAFPELTVQNVAVDLENPTAGRELARERLHPDRFPVRQIRLTEVA